MCRAKSRPGITGAKWPFMRFAKSTCEPNVTGPKDGLRVGFVPGLESALLVLAQELGLFERHGLRVCLCREIGWATVREKIMHQELDAAVTPASLLFSIYAGLSGLRRSCLTGLCLGQSANSIILSQALKDWGVRDMATLASLIRQNRGRRTFSFGVSLEMASQHFQLFDCLSRAGLNPREDVDLTVIPSTLLHESLRQGYLNGFIAPPPASTLAVLEGSGWVVATARELGGAKFESVLLVLEDFAAERHQEHLHLMAALLEASAYGQDPSHREHVLELLTRSKQLGLPKSCLLALLGRAGPCKVEQLAQEEAGAYPVFATQPPSRSFGKAVLEQFHSLSPNLPAAFSRTEILSKVFREELFHGAKSLVGRSRGRSSLRGDLPGPIGATQKPPRIKGFLPCTLNRARLSAPSLINETSPVSREALSV